MNFLKDAIYEKPSFEKKAEYELPKDISEWNEEILKDFFTEVPYIPKDAGVDVVINNVEENKGYAKGSVVVFYKTRKINFPIIVKDFKMFPFDVFVADLEGKQTFLNVSERNVKSYLMVNEISEIKNMYDYAYSQNLKTPGDVAPKPSVPLDQAYHDFVIQDQAMYNMRKMSCLNKANVEDLEKFAVQLKADENVNQSFYETTGDLKNQVIDLINEKRTILKEKDEGRLDINNVIKAKQTLVTLDSEMFDVNNLVPIKAPSVCEIRLAEYPSMDDFMNSGASAIGRLEASKAGKPVQGIVVAIKTIYDYGSSDAVEEYTHPNTNDPEERKKFEQRNPINQIFISVDGKYYSRQNDHKRTGVCFYGTKVISIPGLMEKVIKNMSAQTVDDFYRFDQSNHNDGADKVFNPSWRQNEGTGGACRYFDKSMRYGQMIGNPDSYHGNSGIFILYGASDMWECIEIDSVSSVWTVDGRKVYMSNDVAIIPANIASVQKVKSVNTLTQPEYKMVLGNIKNIYLIPENSIILGKRTMRMLKEGEIMSPSKAIQSMYEEKAISKISVLLGKEGYKITGAPIEPLTKIARLNGEFDTEGAISAFRIMGVAEPRAKEILKTALDKGSVTVYGLTDDYINKDVFKPMEKTAKIKSLYKQIAAGLKTDLVKEASVISDPEAVDTVLSLNFINEENLNDYISNISAMKRIVTKLTSMLVASRMGLSDIDEGAARKAIDGLEKVIEGLESVKMALGK